MDTQQHRIRKRRSCHLLSAFSFLVAAAIAPAALAQTKPAANPDGQCLACHGDRELKSAAGRSVYVNEAKHKASVHADLSCTTCHDDIQDFPHPARVKTVECSSCHAEENGAVQASIHATLGTASCSSCHGAAHDIGPAAKFVPQTCGSCHAAEAKDFLDSAHGAAFKAGDPQSPSCLTCHGAVHKISASADPAAPTAKKNQAANCGACHADQAFLAKHQIPFAHPVETYQSGVHGRALAAGNANAAACSDCHTAHKIYAARDSRASINHWNVPKTCAACHSEIAKTYESSVHGQAVAHGVVDAPVCTDCHGDHSILGPGEQQSLVNPARVSFVTCGRCHGDERLDARYNLPTDRLPTFVDSYHGLAARAGSQTVANCASCHGVHNIFASADPRSTVNAANLANTCGACHAGASQVFLSGPIHAAVNSKNEAAAARWIRGIYLVLIPVTIGFMFFHHTVDFLHKLRERMRVRAKNEVVRMNLHFRIAHWLVVISFPTLVLTGFALKFPESWWARPLLIGESRFAFRGMVHRGAAVVLLGLLGYHLVHLAISRRDRAFWREMLPRWRDVRDVWGMLSYNMGFSRERPTFGRFSYVEKIEYLAFLWGTAVMALTGFVLWFNNFAMRHFQKWVSDAASSLHFYEAILATAAIAVWHMYTVIFDPDVYPMDQSWLTGKMAAEHLRELRPRYFAELAQLEPADPAKEQDNATEPIPTKQQ
jgi:formate dehydrogenase gamma subunit